MVVENRVLAEKFLDLSRVLAKMIHTYGVMLKTTGEIEKTSGKRIEELLEYFSKPELLMEIVKDMPKDIVGEFFMMIMEMAALSQKLKDFTKLNPDEKISMGERLINLSERMNRLIEKVVEEAGKRE